MYSAELQTLIERAQVNIADEVKVITKSKTYLGVLMPRPETGSADCLVVKLNNGYNVGLKYESSMKVQSSKEKKTKATRQEADFELGKVKAAKPIEFDSSKPGISLITTGGTITSRVDYKTGGVTSLMSPAELLNVAPELAEFVNLKNVHNPFTRMSEDMTFEDYKALAELAASELNKEDIKGIIITHGTDVLHYTSAALSFMLQNLSKPVILTAAQRSSDRPSADATINLICSSHAALNDVAEVGICMHGSMNDDYCLFMRGTKVRKMHTSRRDTFRPVNSLPLLKIWPEGKIEVIEKEYRKRTNSKVTVDTNMESKVGFLKTYPESDPEVLDYFMTKGYKGFVLEATGFGHVPTHTQKSWIAPIKKLIEQGIPVVIASQAFYGRINTKVYSNLRTLFGEAGAIEARDMLPETAYIKLAWVLGHETKLEKVREMMLTNYVGEISDRTLPETFLY